MSGSYVNAGVRTDVKPFNVIAKMEYDRNSTDPKQLVDEITEVLLENLEAASGDAFRIVESSDGMEQERPIRVIRFPAAMVNGKIQYANQLEIWTNEDDDFLSGFGPRYGVATPWNISIVSSPDMMRMMLNMLAANESIGEFSPKPEKDLILVTMMNPLVISKTIYRDLPWMDNIAFNSHCRRLTGIVEKSVMTVLRSHTGYDWKPSASELIYDGIPVTKEDVDAIPITEALPSMHIARYSADTVSGNYKAYLRNIPALFKPGAPLENVGKMVVKLFTDLFSWIDPESPFECDLTPYGGPVIRFENLDDFKAQFPGMVNKMFLPLWKQNLVAQPWKYIRAIREGREGEVQIVEMCSKFYASMAMGTGMHHASALPAMVGFWEQECGDPHCPVGCGSNVNMIASSASFSWYFKDAVMMMDMMNMPVQSYLFQNFPKLIRYEISALINGGLAITGARERLPLPPWE